MRAAEALEQSSPIEDALHASEAFLCALRAGVGPLGPATPLPPRTPNRHRRVANACLSASSEFAAVAAAAAAVAASAIAEDQADDPSSFCPPGWLISSVQGLESTDTLETEHSRPPSTSLSPVSEPAPRHGESSPSSVMRTILSIPTAFPRSACGCSSKVSAGSVTSHNRPVSAVMTFATPTSCPRSIPQAQGGRLGIWMGGLGLHRSFSDQEAADSRVAGHCRSLECCTIAGGEGSKSYCLVLGSESDQCNHDYPINMLQGVI